MKIAWVTKPRFSANQSVQQRQRISDHLLDSFEKMQSPKKTAFDPGKDEL